MNWASKKTKSYPVAEQVQLNKQWRKVVILRAKMWGNGRSSKFITFVRMQGESLDCGWEKRKREAGVRGKRERERKKEERLSINKER